MYAHLLQVYTGSYRLHARYNNKKCDSSNVEDLNMIEKVALNVENCRLRPLIARVTDLDDDMMDVLWLDGRYFALSSWYL